MTTRHTEMFQRGAWPGAGYRLISGGKSKVVRIHAPSTSHVSDEHVSDKNK
jgi:hypothetical protein